MKGGTLPFTANVEAIVWNKMYEKLNPKPIPKCNPIPPFVFLEDKDTPISVRIKEANDMAMRLWYSISNSLMLAKPRCRCLLMYSLS